MSKCNIKTVRFFRLPLLVLVLAGCAKQAPPAPTQPVAPKVLPIFSDGMAQVVAGFADSTQFVRQRVWVETDFDSDSDGKNDRIHADITRPGIAERQGTKVPIIMESSPYFGGQNSPNEFLWNVKQELGVEPPPRKSRPDKPFDPAPAHLGRALTRQWVPRGFAVVSSEQPGTGLSTGCPTVGDRPETTAPKFVIDWLNGRAKGYTSVDGTEEVSATTWSSGKVGMIGTSYNGTLPISAALTGVKGLEAIIPISPNTSYYHYYRSNGLVRSPGGYLGEDVDFLYDFIHSGRVRGRCDSLIRDGLFAKLRDRAHGDYSDFWAARDQLLLIKNVKAAVFFAHGFNDWNVVPEHTIRMWEALKKINPSSKIYLHQGGHGGAPPDEVVNKWWTHYLYGVDNGIEKTPRALIVPSTAPGGRGARPTPPQGYDDYPIPGSAPVTVFASKSANAVGGLNSNKPSGTEGVETLVDDVQFAPGVLAAAANSPNRLIYATPVLTDSLHLSGTPRVTLRLGSNKPAANLSVYLVTLPFDPAPIGTSGQVGVVTRGWADPQNYRSLKGGNYDSKAPGEPLAIGRFYEMTFDLQPDDQIIVPGKQLAVMILSSDRGFTLWPTAGTQLIVDLDSSSFVLPVVGGQAAYRKATGGK